jgi:hypothetical protein
MPEAGKGKGACFRTRTVREEANRRSVLWKTPRPDRLAILRNRVTKKAAKHFSALMALMALEVTGPIHAQNLSPGGPGLRNQPGAPDVPVPTRRTAEGPAFVKLYKEAFPQEAAAARAARVFNLLINHTTTLRAMATFMRTVITRNTAFDRFPAGDNGALSQNQLWEHGSSSRPRSLRRMSTGALVDRAVLPATAARSSTSSAATIPIRGWNRTSSTSDSTTIHCGP